MSYTYRGKGSAPKTATRAGEPSLLAYVIAYLQEEQRRLRLTDQEESANVSYMVAEAAEAYEAGAR